MNTLISTVGLPRSGKSTWARQQRLPVVNPDAIRLALHGQAFYAPAEAFVWATAHLMVQSLFGAGHKSVILDATNINERRRGEWRSKTWTNTYTCFETSVVECERRALANNQLDLIPIIHRMARDLTWPTGIEPGRTHEEVRFFHWTGEQEYFAVMYGVQDDFKPFAQNLTREEAERLADELSVPQNPLAPSAWCVKQDGPR